MWLGLSFLNIGFRLLFRVKDMKMYLEYSDFLNVLVFLSMYFPRNFTPSVVLTTGKYNLLGGLLNPEKYDYLGGIIDSF